MIIPRDYQLEAFEALDNHMREKNNNPLTVLPTGSGKSYCVAYTIQQWKKQYPPLRVCILAHRKELVSQNYEEMKTLWPDVDAGIYAASLGRRDEDNSIIFAQINSIYKKWGSFKFDLLMVDECHHIPMRGEGLYLSFINGCKIVNKDIKICGWTATPYRLGCGAIAHPQHPLNEICYEANVGDLIAKKYLCMLRSKVGDVQPDISEVKRNHGGDYIESDLARVTNTPDLVGRTIKSAMTHIVNEKRKSVVFFTVDVNHCKAVSDELRKYGVDAPIVTAKTPALERDRITKGFKDGRYKAMVNVNCMTEGFNAKQLDCVVLLRPTLSCSLYVQMCGRGLRLHPQKEFCLILDYSRTIENFGPVDCIEPGEVRIEECQSCGDVFSRAIRKCPHCGWVIPKEIIERKEAEEREKKMHEAVASQKAIIGSLPEELQVSDIKVHRHKKAGNPDSLRVEYRCGLTVFREWICLDHVGYAGKKARQWWMSRFGRPEAEAVSVDSALQDMLLGHRLHTVTTHITVVRRGKYSEIVNYRLKPE